MSRADIDVWEDEGRTEQIATVLGEPRRRVRLYAIHALARRGTPDALDALRRGLRDRSRSVALAAVEALREHAPEASARTEARWHAIDLNTERLSVGKPIDTAKMTRFAAFKAQVLGHGKRNY